MTGNLYEKMAGRKTPGHPEILCEKEVMTARAFFMKSDRKKDADMGKNSLKIKMAGLAGSLMLTAVLFSGFGVAAEKNIPEPPVSQGAPASSEEEPGARLARMREFREAIQEKWNALSDEQKQPYIASSRVGSSHFRISFGKRWTHTSKKSWSRLR